MKVWRVSIRRKRRLTIDIQKSGSGLKYTRRVLFVCSASIGRPDENELIIVLEMKMDSSIRGVFHKRLAESDVVHLDIKGHIRRIEIQKLLILLIKR